MPSGKTLKYKEKLVEVRVVIAEAENECSQKFTLDRKESRKKLN